MRIHQPLIRLILMVCIAFAGLYSANVSADNPKEFTAHYILRKGAINLAKAEVKLVKKDGYYLYTSKTKPVGLIALFRNDRITETSKLTIQNNTIQPMEYRYQHEGKKKRNVNLTFDWQEMQVTNDVQGHSWNMEIPAGTLDKFSVRLAATMSLNEDTVTIEYKIADGGTLKTYAFTNMGIEMVETPAGNFKAIKIERVRTKKTRKTYLWCAPALNNLPVRVEHVESDGGKFNMVLDKVEFNQKQSATNQ